MVIKVRSQKSPLVLPPLFLVAVYQQKHWFVQQRGHTGSTASDQDVPNEKESDTRDGVPSPLVPLTLVVGRSSDTGKETSDDHEDIGKDGQEGGSGGQTREDTKGD